MSDVALRGTHLFEEQLSEFEVRPVREGREVFEDVLGW